MCDMKQKRHWWKEGPTSRGEGAGRQGKHGDDEQGERQKEVSS